MSSPSNGITKNVMNEGLHNNSSDMVIKRAKKVDSTSADGKSIHPYWLESALNASEQGHISDIKHLVDEVNNGGKWDFLKSINKIKGDEFIRVAQHPFIQGLRFGPDEADFTMNLPAIFPINAGRLRFVSHIWSLIFRNYCGFILRVTYD